MRMGGCYAMYQYRTMTSIWMEKQGWLSSFLSVQVDIFSEEVTLVKTKQKQIISDNIFFMSEIKSDQQGSNGFDSSADN